MPLVGVLLGGQQNWGSGVFWLCTSCVFWPHLSVHISSKFQLLCRRSAWGSSRTWNCTLALGCCSYGWIPYSVTSVGHLYLLSCLVLEPLILVSSPSGIPACHGHATKVVLLWTHVRWGLRAQWNENQQHQCQSCYCVCTVLFSSPQCSDEVIIRCS